MLRGFSHHSRTFGPVGLLCNLEIAAPVQTCIVAVRLSDIHAQLGTLTHGRSIPSQFILRKWRIRIDNTARLFRFCHREVLQQKPFLQIRQEVLRVAHWQAARYGLQARLIDPLSGEFVSVPKLLELLLHFLRPALQEQGDWERVSRTVERVLHQGNGATRQRAVYERTGQFRDVVDFVVRETAREIA